MTRKHHPSLIDSVYDSGRFPLSGGGPLPLLGNPNHIELIQHLRQLSQDLEAPKQILVISALWEACVIQITHHSNPPLFY